MLVKGQSSPLLNVNDFTIPLLPHQAYAADWIDKINSKSLIIHAPTGSGKTLAAVASLLRLAKQSGRVTGVFIYPTNELIKNQAASISLSLTNLGFKPRIIGYPLESHKDGYDIPIIEGFGEVLHALAFRNSYAAKKHPKLRSFGSVLADLLTYVGKIRILATNPDSLYLAVSAKYGSAAQIMADIFHADLFVIDEFHAYYGISLANLIYTLKIIDLLSVQKRYLFLSATPSVNLFDIIKDLFQETTVIKFSNLLTRQQRDSVSLNYTESNTSRQISYDVILSLRPKKRLDDSEDLKNLVTEILNEEKQVHRRKTVPCVIIVNSVLDAVTISNFLEKSGLHVSQVHGLVPKHRRRIDDQDYDIVVGTSAIELGIDFHAYCVIFEGREAASFLQRFGRIGRHFGGKAYGFVPVNVVDSQPTTTFEREDFEMFVYDKLTEYDNYSDFAKSIGG